MMRNLAISVLVIGLLSLLPLSPRVGHYRRVHRRVVRRAYRRSYYY